MAFKLVVGCAVRHRIIEAHLFFGLNVTQRHQRDLAAQPQIRLARVIHIVGRLQVADRRQIQPLVDLDGVMLRDVRQFGQQFFRHDVAAPYDEHFTSLRRFAREHAKPAFFRVRPDLQLRRKIVNGNLVHSSSV